jgi:phenylacetate-CoA ligase
MNKRARWTPAQLEAYQQKKLQQIIRYAYIHVPYYRRKFRELNLSPEAIKTTDDLNKLPIVTKKEIKQNLPSFISDEYDAENLKAVSTSGSTGEPLFLYLSEFEVEFRKAKHLRANMSLGQKPRDRWVTLTGPQHVAKTTRLQRMVGLYVPVTVSVFDALSAQISALTK